MTLKTLKDLVCCPPLMKEELKAEAIKWVKYIRQLGLDEMIWCEFFNLTEEDFK